MEIPILGQPRVVDWFITLEVRCPCGHTLLLVGQPGSMRQCAKCRKLLELGREMTTNPQTGELSVQVIVLGPPRDPGLPPG